MARTIYKLLRSILKWIPELTALLLFNFNLIFRLLNPFFLFDNVKKEKKNQQIIIIFEQWFFKNYWHILMKKYLESRGYRVYWTNYSLIKGNPDKGARYLKKYIESNRIDDAVLVGVSMGAVSSLSYLQRYEGWTHIKKFISIAGPFRGAPLTQIMKFIPKIKSNTTDNDYFQNLVSEPIKNPDRIVSIVAKRDEIVPTHSSWLINAENKKIPVSGHNYLHMFSKQVFETIANEAAN